MLAALNVAGKPALQSAADNRSIKPLSREERLRIPVTSWRTFESGFHNGPNVVFDKLDPEWFMAQARRAHVQCIIVQSKDIWGHAYYNTKVGMRHPNLTYDLLARWVELGHRNGLAVVAYYSGQIDIELGLKRPELVSRLADGKMAFPGTKWLWCCHNSPYRDHAKAMYQEIFSHYDLDGLFIDGTPWPRWYSEDSGLLCYCEWCQKSYGEEEGESFLEGIDTTAGRRKRQDWLQRSSERYLDEVYAIVHSLRPGLPIWLNTTSPFDMSTRVTRKTSCLYTEPLASPTGLSIGSLVLRGWQMPGPQVGIFWRGYLNDPLSVEKFRTAAVMLQGVRPRFITDNQNMPDGRSRPGMFKWAGSLMEDVEKVEGLLQDLEPVASLGVLFSEATLAQQRAEDQLSLTFVPGPFVKSISGCLEILAQTQYPLDVLPPWRLSPDALANFQMLVLPETDVLTEAEGEAIRAYVQQGGKLLATWKCGLTDEQGTARTNFLLADVLGANYGEEISRYAGKDGPGIYFQTNGHPLSAFIGPDEVAILEKSGRREPTYCPFLKVEGPAESILDYRLPYMVPDVEKYKFDTLNVAPPGNEKIPRAAAFHQFGKGETVYVGVPLFQRYQPEVYWIRDWVHGLVRRLVPNPPLRVEGNSAIHATFFRQGSKRLVVQMLNSGVWTTRGQCAPARNLQIVGRTDLFQVRSARLLWPREQPLMIESRQSWRVKVPEVSIHAIAAIELA